MQLPQSCALFSCYDRSEQGPQLLCGLRIYRPPFWNRWSGGSSHAAVWRTSGRGKPVSFLRPQDRPDQGPILVRRRICSLVQATFQRPIPVAQVRIGTSATGSPELPLAHGGSADRAENCHPQRKTQGPVLSKTEYYCTLSCRYAIIMAG